VKQAAITLYRLLPALSIVFRPVCFSWVTKAPESGILIKQYWVQVTVAYTGGLPESGCRRISIGGREGIP
jgi:hypothetical protein